MSTDSSFYLFLLQSIQTMYLIPVNPVILIVLHFSDTVIIQHVFKKRHICLVFIICRYWTQTVPFLPPQLRSFVQHICLSLFVWDFSLGLLMMDSQLVQFPGLIGAALKRAALSLLEGRKNQIKNVLWWTSLPSQIECVLGVLCQFHPACNKITKTSWTKQKINPKPKMWFLTHFQTVFKWGHIKCRFLHTSVKARSSLCRSLNCVCCHICLSVM